MHSWHAGLVRVSLYQHWLFEFLSSINLETMESENCVLRWNKGRHCCSKPCIWGKSKHFLTWVWKWKDFFLWLLSACLLGQCRWVLKTRNLLCSFQAKMARCFLYVDKENQESFRGDGVEQYCLPYKDRAHEWAAVHVSWWWVSSASISASKASHQIRTWDLSLFYHMPNLLIALSRDIAEIFCSGQRWKTFCFWEFLLPSCCPFHPHFQPHTISDLVLSPFILPGLTGRFHWVIAALG